jgi:mono/diheme cytochrome c family protein
MSRRATGLVRTAPWALVFALFTGAACAADIATKARLQYLQHCVGCHGMDGSGAPAKGVPSMQGTLGRFLQQPGGREFIVQVPGVMNSPLSDRDVADLMNWLLPHVSAPTLPASLAPYEAAEIARLRASRPADIPAQRQRLIDAALANGLRIEP